MSDNNKLTKEELEVLKDDLKRQIMEEINSQEKPNAEEQSHAIDEEKTHIIDEEELQAIDDKEPQVVDETHIKIKPETTEFKIPTKSKIDKFDRNINNNNNNESRVENVSSSSNLILIVALFVVVAGIFFLPKVSEMFNKTKSNEPAKTEKKEEEPEEKIEYKWDSDIIKGITLPIMRDDKYSPESYYKNDSMTISNFSNNDILYNAFVNIFSGNIATYTEGYAGRFCGTENQRKTFNAKYIDARIDNMFTKNAKYNLEDFYVPLSANTDYVGLWRYDAGNNRFIYYGECNKTALGGTQYIDILVEDEIKTSDDSKTAYLTYGIGFAKLANNNYEIYSDLAYTDKILEGTLETNNYEKELKDVLTDSKKELKKYQYEYSTINCSYSELCYISGKWINE